MVSTPISNKPQNHYITIYNDFLEWWWSDNNNLDFSKNNITSTYGNCLYDRCDSNLIFHGNHIIKTMPINLFARSCRYYGTSNLNISIPSLLLCFTLFNEYLSLPQSLHRICHSTKKTTQCHELHARSVLIL